MKKLLRKNGFSIIEVLIAIGVLSVALMLIAGVFPVGIRLTQVAIDNTTAAIVANEAFAKIQLYANQVPDVNFSMFGFDAEQHRDFNDWFMYRNDKDHLDMVIDSNAFLYPSDHLIYEGDKKYCWSALCRLIAKDPDKPKDNEHKIQTTVFVCNRGNHNRKFYKANIGDGDSTSYASKFENNNYGEIVNEFSNLPQPIRVEVALNSVGVENEIRIQQNGQEILINDGNFLVDDYSGEIYRVLERYPAPDDDIVLLDKNWKLPAISSPYYMWLIPPSAVRGYTGSEIMLSGKSPCIGIYQKVIRF